jgi:hypothetical protein
METDPLQSSSSKSVLLFIVIFLLGGIVGVAADPYLPSAVSSAKKSYTAGFAAARKVVEESKYGNLFRTPEDVRVLSGVVASVRGDELTLKVSSTVSPFDDAALAERIVRITSETKLTKLVAKDPKAYQKELATPATTPPSPFTLTAISAKDIKEGDSLTVTAVENVKTMREFVASEIRVDLGIPLK